MRHPSTTGHAKRLTLAAVAAAALAATAFIPLSAQAADALLSGSITSAAGEKLGGVTVSAKAEGATITTTVFTDEAGNYYFPPLPRRQVPGLGAGADLRDRQGRGRSRRRQAPGLQARRRCRTSMRQLPGDLVLASLPERHRRRRAPEEPRAQQLHRLPYAELSAAAQVRRGGLERDHRPDEARQRLRRLSGPRPQAQRRARLQSEGAGGLPGARARTRRELDEVQAAAAPDRRGRARRVQGIRRPGAGRRQHAGQIRRQRRQRLVARHALAHRLAGARRLGRSRRQHLVHLQRAQSQHQLGRIDAADRRGRRCSRCRRPERHRRQHPRHDPRSATESSGSTSIRAKAASAGSIPGPSRSRSSSRPTACPRPAAPPRSTSTARARSGCRRPKARCASIRRPRPSPSTSRAPTRPRTAPAPPTGRPATARATAGGRK